MDSVLSQALWTTNKQWRNSDSQKPRHKTPPPKHGGNGFLAFNTERRHDSDGHGHFKTFDRMMMRAALLNLLSQLPWDQEFGITKKVSSEWLPFIWLAIVFRYSSFTECLQHSCKPVRSPIVVPCLGPWIAVHSASMFIIYCHLVQPELFSRSSQRQADRISLSYHALLASSTNQTVTWRNCWMLPLLKTEAKC